MMDLGRFERYPLTFGLATLEGVLTDPVYRGEVARRAHRSHAERTIRAGARVLDVGLGGTPVIGAYSDGPLGGSGSAGGKA